MFGFPDFTSIDAVSFDDDFTNGSVVNNNNKSVDEEEPSFLFQGSIPETSGLLVTLAGTAVASLSPKTKAGAVGLLVSIFMIGTGHYMITKE